MRQIHQRAAKPLLIWHHHGHFHPPAPREPAYVVDVEAAWNTSERRRAGRYYKE